MKSKQLNHISKIIAGQSPPSSTYNYTGEGLPFFQGKTDFQEKYPTARMWCTSEHRKESYPGDILISVRAPVGAVNICNQKSIIGRGLAAIRPNADTYGLYLYYYLKANEKQIEALGTGSTFKAITQDTLKKIEIPTPDFDDQKRIAHLLDTVDGLISERKKHLQQLDALLQSIFMEMFGDPVRNEKGWDQEPFTKIGKFISGGTPSKQSNEFWCGTFPWVSPKDMKVSTIVDSIDHISDSAFEKTSLKRISKGHLLIVVRGMILAHSFPVAVNAVDIAINQDMKAIKPTPKYDVIFLQHCIMSLKRQILKQITSAAHGTCRFDSSSMQRILIIQPLPVLQSQFAAIVKKVEGIKQHYQHSLTQMENLYGVLSQKAFKGELDLSRVVLPAEAGLPVLRGSAPKETSFNLEEIAKFGYRLAEFAYQAAQAIAPLLVPLAAASIGFQRGLQDAARALQKSKASQEILFSAPMPATKTIESPSHDNRACDIDAILEACIKELGTVPFSVQDFLDAVRRELEDIADDPGQVQGVTLAVYEHVKTWIFNSLERGNLKQFFDATDNAVYFRHVDAV